MLAKAIQLRLISISIVLTSASFAYAQPKYAETVSVLQTLCRNEMQAYFTYLAYAQEADSENYPNIAYLLVSVGTSESIHAHNFEKLLSDLVVEVEKARITAKMIKSIRERLGLSQAKIAKILGVAPNTVLLWEQKEGWLTFGKPETKAAIVRLRGMPKTEVAKMLE